MDDRAERDIRFLRQPVGKARRAMGGEVGDEAFGERGEDVAFLLIITTGRLSRCVATFGLDGAFVISSGPMRYGSVTLPDPEVRDQSLARCGLWRTDVDDAACGANLEKIGWDADGQPGGCDNLLKTIAGATATTAYQRLSD